MTEKIQIRRINGERCVYQGNRLVANIYDHRGRSKTDRYSTIQGDWGVAWTSGRYDWHNTYAEARDNALKGPAAVAAPAGLASDRIVFETVDERYTTRTCSCCRTISASSPKGRAGLRIREWTCSDCGAVHDRDVNAARNILTAGHRRLAEGTLGCHGSGIIGL